MSLDTLRASVKELRPFVPCSDLAQSIAFYEALGFAGRQLGPDLAELRIGEFSFLLQRYGARRASDYFVMHLMVDDLDGWWAQIDSLDAQGLFTQKPKPPALQSWGLRVAFLVDPAGVLWHVAERPA